MQLPLTSENANLFTSTLVREMLTFDLKLNSKKEYLITVSDEVSSPIMEYISKIAKSELCLYSHLQINFREKGSN